MLNKEIFIKYLNKIQSYFERQNKLYTEASRLFVDTQFLIYDGELDFMIELLQAALNLNHSHPLLDYFIFELNFGTDERAANGIEIMTDAGENKLVYLTSAEALYDCIMLTKSNIRLEAQTVHEELGILGN